MTITTNQLISDHAATRTATRIPHQRPATATIGRCRSKVREEEDQEEEEKESEEEERESQAWLGFVDEVLFRTSELLLWVYVVARVPPSRTHVHTNTRIHSHTRRKA